MAAGFAGVEPAEVFFREVAAGVDAGELELTDSLALAMAALASAARAASVSDSGLPISSVVLLTAGG